MMVVIEWSIVLKVYGIRYRRKQDVYTRGQGSSVFVEKNQANEQNKQLLCQIDFWMKFDRLSKSNSNTKVLELIYRTSWPAFFSYCTMFDTLRLQVIVSLYVYWKITSNKNQNRTRSTFTNMCREKFWAIRLWFQLKTVHCWEISSVVCVWW